MNAEHSIFFVIPAQAGEVVHGSTVYGAKDATQQLILPERGAI